MRQVAVKFTEDQKNAIYAKGTVLVSAAAGSGKTAVLTERVVNMIADEKNKIGADRLLIVTFTNASALEMRVRISRRLNELCEESPKNAYLLKQKLLLKNAKICTIDAFCIDLVRTYFAVLGINPDFSVADSAQTEAIKETALNSVLQSRFIEKSSAFNALCLLFGVDKSEKSLMETVYMIHDYCMCMKQPDKWLESAASGYSCKTIEDCVFVPIVLDYIRENLASCKDSIEVLLREIAGSDIESAYFDGLNFGREEIISLINATDSFDWDSLYLRLSEFKIPVKTVKKTNDPSFKETVKGERDAIIKRVTSLSKRMTGTKDEVVKSLGKAAPIVYELISIVKDYKNKYFELLLKRNLLTFSHIEQLALKLLCEEKNGELVPTKLSKEICKNFDEVLVDEYQDNNNLQDALFLALSDGGKHLFMVGDVKQSIYGFRNASPDNFIKYKEDFAQFDGVNSPSKVILKQNFRSRKGICEFVNALCNTVMNKQTCGMDYTDEDKLDAKAEYADSEQNDVCFMINEASKSSLKREQIDAEQIAEKIKNLLNQPPFLRGVNGLRKAEYKDFAILLRSPSSRACYYVDALKKRGIPVAYNTDEFFESQEVLTAVSMLRVIDNPTREIPLLSVLMSVMFGFTADDLAELRIKYGHKNLYSVVCAAAANGDERCSYFVNLLSKLRTKAITMPVGRLLNEIYNLTLLPEAMSVKPECKQSRVNLLRLVAIANKLDGTENNGIIGFLAEFDRMNKVKSSSGQAVGSDINAVKIMSFHGSKGLQYPICFIADCGGLFNKTDVTRQIILNDKYGIGLKFIDDDDVKAPSLAREALSVLQQKKLISEEIRLLYVALTRAEEKLYISITLPDVAKKIVSSSFGLGFLALQSGKASSTSVISANGYYEWLFMTALLQSSGDVISDFANLSPLGYGGDSKFDCLFSKTIDIENSQHQSNDVIVEKKLIDEKEISLLVDEISERFNYKYSHSNLSDIPSKMAVTSLVHGDNNAFSFTARPRFMSKAGLTPAERGTAAHKFMQYASFDNAEEDIESEVNRLYEWEYLSLEEVEALEQDKLKKFFNSKVYERIKNAEQVKREYKFMVDYPYLEHSTIVQGIADCLIFEPDGVVILDFKTDRVDNLATLCEMYAPQLSVYKYAIEKITGKKVKECILYSLFLSKEVRCLNE